MVHFYQGTTFRPEDGNTTITSDLAIEWADLGIVQILGDGCGCGVRIEVTPGVTMEPVTHNPNRPFMPEDMEEVATAPAATEEAPTPAKKK
jgi:hypothetical protein